MTPTTSTSLTSEATRTCSHARNSYATVRSGRESGTPSWTGSSDRASSAPWPSLEADLRQADPGVVGGVYDQLAALYEHFNNAAPPGIGMAKTSKVLHLKRPTAYPILDRKITSTYRHAAGRWWGLPPIGRRGSRGGYVQPVGPQRLSVVQVGHPVGRLSCRQKAKHHDYRLGSDRNYHLRCHRCGSTDPCVRGRAVQRHVFAGQ
jgi:hypothetical protein